MQLFKSIVVRPPVFNLEMEIKTFWTEDKFSPVIEYLLAKHWTRVEEQNEALLAFTNLIKVNFDLVSESEFVNHFKGSQNLSNKALLSYHMFASGFSRDMPLQWSSAFNTIPELLGMLVEYHMKYQPVTPFMDLRLVTRILNILKTDSVWANSSQALQLTQALDHSQHAYKCAEAPKDSSPTQEALWIIKPVGLSCGENIHVARGFLSTLRAVQRLEYKCIVQKYIERPLLLRNRQKFDIRQWILVTNLNPLVIYAFSECYARLSAQEFTTEDSSLANPTVHLCNHAIQKHAFASASDQAADSAVVTGDSDAIGAYCATMMTEAQMEANIDVIIRNGAVPAVPVVGGGAAAVEESVFRTVIKPQIKLLALHAVSAVRDKLQRVGKGFEWLGLDIMVTESMEAQLLEVNVSPDISLSTSVTARLVTPAVSDLFQLVIEEQAVLHTPIHFSDVERILEYKSPRHPDCHSAAPHSPLSWQLWHQEPFEPVEERMAFARQKKATRLLQAAPAHAPLHQQILSRVEAVLLEPPSLNTASGHGYAAIEDEEDEDEI